LVAVHQVWDSLLAKGRLDSETVGRYKTQLHTASQLHDLKDCDLIVEAIVERLDIKKSLFVELENLVSDSTVLVTNTSSLSVTAIGAALKRPAQFAGYHFFNPVPLMKVVEVIAGLKTNSDVCARLTEFANKWDTHPFKPMTRLVLSSTMRVEVMAQKLCALCLRAWPTLPPSIAF
jgi:3-hydroxybutyryl-CoA dehydrogenase